MPSAPEPADDYYFRSDSPLTFGEDTLENLPIASRFLGTSPAFRQAPHQLQSDGAGGSKTPTIPPADGESDDEGEDQIGRGYASGKNKLPVRSTPHSPYGSSALRGKSSRTNLPFPSRSHQSLPPPPRPNAQASTTSLGRQSMLITTESDLKGTSKLTKKLHKKNTSGSGEAQDTSGSLAPHLLPEDLRQCLEVLEGGILSGHMALSEGLRTRYEEQYPLVRSLADVFVSNVRNINHPCLCMICY